MSEPAPGLTVAQAIRAATAQLGPGTDGARFDAEVLMAHALGVSRSELFLRRMHDPAPAVFADLVARRAGHEPVAHIRGFQEFWGLEFKVSAEVLIPRGDSEVLVFAADRSACAAGRSLRGTGNVEVSTPEWHKEITGIPLAQPASASKLIHGIWTDFWLHRMISRQHTLSESTVVFGNFCVPDMLCLSEKR